MASRWAASSTEYWSGSAGKLCSGEVSAPASCLMRAQREPQQKANCKWQLLCERHHSGLQRKNTEVWSLHKQAEGSSSPANFCYHTVQFQVYPNKLVLKIITWKYAWYHELPQVSLPWGFHRREMGTFTDTCPQKLCPVLHLNTCQVWVHVSRWHHTTQSLGQLGAHLMPLKQPSCVLVLHPSHNTICSYCSIQ